MGQSYVASRKMEDGGDRPIIGRQFSQSYALHEVAGLEETSTSVWMKKWQRGQFIW